MTHNHAFQNWYESHPASTLPVLQHEGRAGSISVVQSSTQATILLNSGNITELAIVETVRPLTLDNKSLPSGSRGTVVHRYAGGKGFEIEFDAPLAAVMTVDAKDIRLARD